MLAIKMPGDGWRQIEEGWQEVVTVSDTLTLFVEYTAEFLSMPQDLRLKARLLSEKEVAAALNEGATMHDLTNLGDERIRVKYSGDGVMVRAGDQVFVAYLE